MRDIKYEVVQKLLEDKVAYDKIKLNHLQSNYNGYQEQLNNLANRIKTSQVVSGVSTAVGVLSGLLLSPNMQGFYSQDLTAPQTYAAAGVAAAGLGIATASTILMHKMENQSEAIEEKQLELGETIQAEQSKIDEVISLQAQAEQHCLPFDVEFPVTEQTTEELETDYAPETISSTSAQTETPEIKQDSISSSTEADPTDTFVQ